MKKASWVLGVIFLFTLMVSGTASAKPIFGILLPLSGRFLSHGIGYEKWNVARH